MAVSFSRTLQALNEDRRRWRFTGLALLCILPTALVWFSCAEITVYEVASTAQLDAVPQNVVAEVEGRVVESNLRIGLVVSEGDVLVVLDAENIQHRIKEARQQVLSARSQIQALQQEVEVKRESLDAHVKARRKAVEESQTLLQVAEARAGFAQQSLKRTEALAANREVSAEQLDKQRSDDKVARALVGSARHAVERGEQDRLADERKQEAELARIRSESVEIEGDLAIHEAKRERLEYELSQRTIRAHMSGRVEEVIPFRIGSVVRPSERLATIVPFEEPRVVAFLPVIAVGRVQPDQPARLRMDGFPWTQYGTRAATVTGVGNEPVDGLIRVELAVIADSNSRIPLQHGQTASVEIAVERASPAMLILRAAGEFLMTRRVGVGSE